MSLIKRKLMGPSFPFSVGTYYTAAPATAAWFTVFERSLSTSGSLDGSGWTGITNRQVIFPYSGGGFDRINNGTQLKITLKAPASGTLSWDKLYIGNGATSGDIYDFDGTQVQVLFSGSASGSVSSGGFITSDAVAYSHDGSRSLVVSMHHTSSEVRLRSSVVGFRHFYTYPASDTASVTNDTMNNDDGSNLYSVTKIEAFGYGSVEAYAVKQFFDRIATPTTARATAYRDLIMGLVNDGDWLRIDGLYMIAGADFATSKTNIKQNNFNLVETGPADGTFVADHGYTGGASSVLSTQFNPNINTGYNFGTSGNNYMLCYLTTNDAVGTGVPAVILNGTLVDSFIVPLYAGNMYAQMLATDSTGAANTNVQGQYAVSRTSSTDFTRWKNGSSAGTVTASPSGVFNAAFPMLFGNNAFQIAAGTFGAAQAFSSQMQRIMARINTYQTAIGNNVY